MYGIHQNNSQQTYRYIITANPNDPVTKVPYNPPGKQTSLVPTPKSINIPHNQMQLQMPISTSANQQVVYVPYIVNAQQQLQPMHQTIPQQNFIPTIKYKPPQNVQPNYKTKSLLKRKLPSPPKTEVPRQERKRYKNNSKGCNIAKYMKMAQRFSNSPEDIAAWIKLRKENFPTKTKREMEKPEQSEEFVVKERVPRVKRERLARVCVKFLNNKCPYGEKCKYSHNEEDRVKVMQRRRENIKRQKSNPRKEKPTLFQKLVEDEKQKEAFVMMEIVKYLCEKDFSL